VIKSFNYAFFIGALSYYIVNTTYPQNLLQTAYSGTLKSNEGDIEKLTRTKYN